MDQLPIKIYLQVEPEDDRPNDYELGEGVTWCQDKLNDGDVEYLQTSNILSMLDVLKTKAEMPNDMTEKHGYVRAINDVINFISKSTRIMDKDDKRHPLANLFDAIADTVSENEESANEFLEEEGINVEEQVKENIELIQKLARNRNRSCTCERAHSGRSFIDCDNSCIIK